MSFLKLPINEPENEVYVPIGKSHLLFGYKNDSIHKNSSILMNVDRHTVKKINEYIVGNSDESVFSSSDRPNIKAFILKAMEDKNYCNWDCVFPFNSVIEATHRMKDLE